MIQNGEAIAPVVIDPGSCYLRVALASSDCNEGVVASRNDYEGLNRPHVISSYVGRVRSASCLSPAGRKDYFSSVASTRPPATNTSPHAGLSMYPVQPRRGSEWFPFSPLSFCLSTICSFFVSYVWHNSTSEMSPGILDIEYPIRRGKVQNWNHFETLVQSALYDVLKVAPEEHPVLLIQHPFCHKAQKEKFTQTCFETWNFPAYYLALSNVTAMYALGCLTGIVVDCGEGVTSVVPVVEGYEIESGMMRRDIGGQDVLSMLAKLHRASTPSQRELLSLREEVQNKHCFVSTEKPLFSGNDTCPPTWHDQVEPVTYELPDGSILSVSEELRQAPEVMFNPSLCGLECESTPGIVDMITRSIAACDIDCRASLFKNVVLIGGNSMYPNFAERLYNELADRRAYPVSIFNRILATSHSPNPQSYLEMLPRELLVDVRRFVASKTPLRVHAPPERNHLGIMGAQVLANLNTFQQMWTSKEEYDERGPYYHHYRRNWF